MPLFDAALTSHFAAVIGAFPFLQGFFLTVCPEALMSVAEHACAENKVLMMNLSAPFLVSCFREPMMAAMPYVDVLFGNETVSANGLGILARNGH